MGPGPATNPNGNDLTSRLETVRVVTGSMAAVTAAAVTAV